MQYTIVLLHLVEIDKINRKKIQNIKPVCYAQVLYFVFFFAVYSFHAR